MIKRVCVLIFCAGLLADFSYAQRKVEVVEAPQETQAVASEKVIKRKVAIGRFSNETQYAKGIFYDKENDPMGKQALDILSAKLAASGKFLLRKRIVYSGCRLHDNRFHHRVWPEEHRKVGCFHLYKDTDCRSRSGYPTGRRGYGPDYLFG